jgi:hypothetical protein
MKVFGKTGELTDRLIIPISWHGNEMAGSTDVNTGGVRISQFKGFFEFAHGGILRLETSCHAAVETS